MVYSNEQSILATRWNTMAQIMMKVISPLSSIVLAHILDPDVFGIVASITLMISFLDVFTEVGFQKYIVFYEGKNQDDVYDVVSVAFWVNLFLSLILFLLLVFFRNGIAILIGIPGKGQAVAVSALLLPLTSFSSIQNALFQRELKYKELFKINMWGGILPLAVTIPLALCEVGYWALIIGRLVGNLYFAIILSYKSIWKPRFNFKFEKLKGMFGYCSWALGESLSTWLASNLDILIVSTLLSSYYVGLYKTTISLVNQLLRIISSSLLPVTYSVISRLRNDQKNLAKETYNSQALLTSIIIPMGIGIFIWRDLAIQIALGPEWNEASTLMGLWALSSSISIAFEYICDDVFRAEGKPIYSFFTHMIYTVIMIPTVYWSALKGYEMLVLVRSALVVICLPIRAFYLKKCSEVRMIHFFSSSIPVFFASAIMAIVGTKLQYIFSNIAWQFIAMGICIIVYFVILSAFPSGRERINTLFTIVLVRRKK